MIGLKEKNGINIPLWSGRSILSYILPNNINLEMVNNSYDNFTSIDKNNTKEKILLSENNKKINIVKIVNGFIQKGTFDKGSASFVMLACSLPYL